MIRRKLSLAVLADVVVRFVQSSRQRSLDGTMMYRAFVVCALASAAVAVAAPPAHPPVFNVWWSNVNSTAVQSSGNQIGWGYSGWQVDENRNATMFRAVGGAAGGSFVADFGQSIAYFTDGQGNCQYTCDITGDTACDSQLNGDALCGYDYEKESHYVGTETLPAGPAVKYAWDDMLGPINMASHELWLDPTLKTVLQFKADFHPFGSWLANITSHYTGFQTTPPPAAYFEVGNMKYCQDGGDSCQNSMSRVYHMISMNKVLNK